MVDDRPSAVDHPLQPEDLDVHAPGVMGQGRGVGPADRGGQLCVALAELFEQARAIGIEPTHVYCAAAGATA